MEFSSFVRRARFPVLAAALLAVALTLFGPAPQEVSAEPRCTAFANPPTVVAGQVESYGGAACTAAGTGGFRIDVTLYRDGTQVDWAVNTCHGEQQCGVRVSAADVEGDQKWCAETSAAVTNTPNQYNQTPKTEMICEGDAF